jgi:hypothetical protein
MVLSLRQDIIHFVSSINLYKLLICFLMHGLQIDTVDSKEQCYSDDLP